MLMKPNTPQEYLQQTENAVRHFYAGLESCWSVYQDALSHWDISKINRPLTPEDRTELDKYLKLAGRYFDLKLSEATFAGSILQVAAIGIRYFSRNEVVPESCKEIVSEKDKAAIPYCVGKELHGLPTGLIVYGGRNQYNHWGEKLHHVNQRVFDVLTKAFYHDMFTDLAFDLSNPSITIYSGEVLLTALQWTTYDVYEEEMSGLLPAPHEDSVT